MRKQWEEDVSRHCEIRRSSCEELRGGGSVKEFWELGGKASGDQRQKLPNFR